MKCYLENKKGSRKQFCGMKVYETLNKKKCIRIFLQDLVSVICFPEVRSWIEAMKCRLYKEFDFSNKYFYCQEVYDEDRYSCCRQSNRKVFKNRYY